MSSAAQRNLPRLIRGAFVLGLAAVLFLTLDPRPPAIPFPGGDKAEHILVFLALSGLAGLGWPSSLARSGFGLLLLGALIEVLQGTSMINRDMSFFDWLADAIGVSAGLVFAIASARLLVFVSKD